MENDASRYITGSDSGRVMVVTNLPEEVVAVLFAKYSRSPEGIREMLGQMVTAGDVVGEPDWDALLDATHDGSDEGGSTNNSLLGWLDSRDSVSERAQAFHEKWVVGYGHSSVAEHAVIHLAVEGVSQLVAKAIEDTRLASFTEKSTRYVPFEADNLVRPQGMSDAAWARCTQNAAAYWTMVETLITNLRNPHFEWYIPYTEAIKSYQKSGTHGDRVVRTADGYEVMVVLGESHPRIAVAAAAGINREYENMLRTKACDTLRYCYPVALATNLGVTINARNLTHLIDKMLGSPVGEVRDVGEEILQVSKSVCPTLLKYAGNGDAAESTFASARLLAGVANAVQPKVIDFLVENKGGARETTSNSVVCGIMIRTERMAAAALLPYMDGRITQVGLVAYLQRNPEVTTHVLAAAFAYLKRERLDKPQDDPDRSRQYPGRWMELAQVDIDLSVDFGAWRDIQRHRLCTQILPIFLTTRLGYEIPREVRAVPELATAYNQMMEASEVCWESEIARGQDPYIVQYLIPFAFRYRALLSMNLRELWHFVSLRSGKQGHPSYRRVAQLVYQALTQFSPEIAKYFECDTNDYRSAR